MRTLFLLLVLLGNATPRATTTETPALHALNLWLEAFNTGDSAKLMAFWQKYGTDAPAPHVSGDQRLLHLTGGMKLVKVMQDNGTHLVAVMEEGSGNYTESTIELASANPLVVKAIMNHPAPPPPVAENPAANDQDLAEQVKSHVAALTAKDQFSGAILIAHNGKLVLDQAWGMADREKQIKNTVDTQFCLGSINKMFTAVAVLQLVQQGKLSLEGTISNYWPDYPNHELASHVKIRQLLSHTGGTGDIFTPEYGAHRLETRSLYDYVKLYGNRPLRFEPGSKSEYSNYGFILLGRLIEIASGETYDSYVQKHIFAPVGMTRTDSRPEIDQVPGRAIGYMKGPSGLQPNTSTLPWSGTSAGGGYSTVGDLLLFASALQSGKLLDPGLLQRATTDQAHTGYGFGFYALKDGIYGHGGGSPGMNGEMHIIPKKGYIIAVLVNRDPFMATGMASFIEAILPAK
jgi:CubicO group peptidase (beta-lactamase class C family)